MDSLNQPAVKSLSAWPNAQSRCKLSKTSWSFANEERVDIVVHPYAAPMDCLGNALKMNKSSAVAEMGDRLATIGMGRKWGGAAVHGVWVPI